MASHGFTPSTAIFTLFLPYPQPELTQFDSCHGTI